MTKHKCLKIIIVLIFLFSSFVFRGVIDFATSAEIPIGKDVKNTLDNTAEKAGLKPEGEKQNNLAVIGSFANYLINFLGVLFLILIIYGGVIWMTAQGNEQKIGKAKSIIINAAIGLTIILLAKVITLVVLEMSRQATERFN